MSDGSTNVACQHVFTVDFEDWYHSNLPSESPDTGKASTLPHSLEKMLGLLGDHSVSATFFVVGEVAERYPSLVQSIADSGHEVQSHGYAHRLVYEMAPEEFRDDIRRAQDVIACAVGTQVTGFRAPSWSVDDRTPWAFEILAEEGYEYDASIFPARTFLFGWDDAPTCPHVMQLPSGADIVEIPTSVTSIWGRRVPWGGGLFLRLWPWWITASQVRRAQGEGQSAVLYIHPRDVDPDMPRDPGLRTRDALIQYLFVSRTCAKLERLFELFAFRPIGGLAREVRERGPHLPVPVGGSPGPP